MRASSTTNPWRTLLSRRYVYTNLRYASNSVDLRTYTGFQVRLAGRRFLLSRERSLAGTKVSNICRPRWFTWQKPFWQREFPWQTVVGVHRSRGNGDKTVIFAHWPFRKTCLEGQQQIPACSEQKEFPVHLVTFATQGSPGAAETRILIRISKIRMPIVLTVTQTLFWIVSPFGQTQKPFAHTEFPVHSTTAIEFKGRSQLCPGSTRIFGRWHSPFLSSYPVGQTQYP